MPFDIQPGSKFEETAKAIKEDHYKRDDRNHQKFKDYIAKVIADLSANGHKSPYATPEAWPNNTAIPGWHFCKHRFTMPGLRGAARLGRIIFAIDKESGAVYLLMVYTHAEYSKRPPDANLKPLVLAAMADSQAAMEAAREQQAQP